MRKCNNPEWVKLKRALKQEATIDRGSFAEYAEDKEVEEKE